MASHPGPSQEAAPRPALPPEDETATPLVVEATATPPVGAVEVDHTLDGPAVRRHVVDRVRLLIAHRFYDKPGFIDKLADRLMQEFEQDGTADR